MTLTPIELRPISFTCLVYATIIVNYIFAYLQLSIEKTPQLPDNMIG